MALRPPSSGSTPVANVPAQYGFRNTAYFTDSEPAALGGSLASSFSRAGATLNPKNASGWRQPSAYSGSLVKYEYMRLSYDNANTTFGRNSFLRGVTPLSGLSAYPGLCTNDLSRARNKALLALKDQTCNLSVAFKERQDTVDTVTTLVKTACNIVKGVNQYLKQPFKRKALLRSLKGKWKDAPEAWLLWRYGIQPTMLDAYGAVEALEKRDNGTYDRYRCTVRGKSTTPIKQKVISSGPETLGRYWTTPATVVRQVLPGSYGARVRYDCALTSPSYLRLSEVGVVNPLEMIWEATTLSFVADWFLSVGDFCKALDATVPFTFIGGSETIFVNWSGSTVISDTSASITESVSPATAKYFTRTVPDSFPFPDLFVLKQDPLNVTRLADALSLLASFAK